MPVLFKVKEGGKLQPEEYINISRIAIWPLTLDLGKKGYLSTASRVDGYGTIKHFPKGDACLPRCPGKKAFTPLTGAPL